MTVYFFLMILILSNPMIEVPPNVTLEVVEELLNPKQFYRANRQFIINIDAIQTVKTVENSKLIIRFREPNHKLDIATSRLKSPEFRKWMDR